MLPEISNQIYIYITQLFFKEELIDQKNPSFINEQRTISHRHVLKV